MSNAEVRARIAIDMAERECASDSARLALGDARMLLLNGHYVHAIRRAAASLCHSVGIFSPSYQLAEKWGKEG